MSSNLFIAAQNAEPEREEQYPRCWLLFKQRHEPIALRVERDPANRPHVMNKSAAEVGRAVAVEIVTGAGGASGAGPQAVRVVVCR
jgi:hypothetical protein